MKRILYAFLAMQAMLLSTNVMAAADMFLKVMAQGFSFNGGATAAGYENQIEMYSYSDGIAGCVTQGGKSCVSTNAGFYFMTKMTRAVIDFKAVQLQSKLLTSADMAWVVPSGTGRAVTYAIHMEDVRVLSVQESGSQGGDNSQSVSVALQPTRVAWKVITMNADGTPGPVSTYGWDFKANAPFNYVFP